VRRCSGFHIGTPLENQVPHKESQPTPPTQQLSGSALRQFGGAEIVRHESSHQKRRSVQLINVNVLRRIAAKLKDIPLQVDDTFEGHPKLFLLKTRAEFF
jgi:hypothetical protein